MSGGINGSDRLVAEWATRGGASGLQLWCHYEGTDSVPGVIMSGNIPAFNVVEWTRDDGQTGELVFNALDEASAIDLVQERVDRGQYTPTGAKNPPARVYGRRGVMRQGV
jgi:hypothetical protein